MRRSLPAGYGATELLAVKAARNQAGIVYDAVNGTDFEK